MGDSDDDEETAMPAMPAMPAKPAKPAIPAIPAMSASAATLSTTKLEIKLLLFFILDREGQHRKKARHSSSVRLCIDEV